LNTGYRFVLLVRWLERSTNWIVLLNDSSVLKFTIVPIFSQQNMDIFNNYIIITLYIKADWNAVCSSENGNFAYNSFIDKIQYAYKKPFLQNKCRRKRAEIKFGLP